MSTTYNLELTRVEVAAVAAAVGTYRGSFVNMGKRLIEEGDTEIGMYDQMLMQLETVFSKVEVLLLETAKSFVTEFAEKGINITLEEIMSDKDTTEFMEDILSKIENQEGN